MEKKFQFAEPPTVGQAFGHVESSVPRGAHSSPITIQQKHCHRTALQGDGRFESKYLKAEADLKANVRKQKSDLKAKIVESQRGSKLGWPFGCL